MPKRQEISSDQLLVIERCRKQNKHKGVEKRLKALSLFAQGHRREQIAMQTGYESSYISKLVKKYLEDGLEAIVGNHYRGNRRNLSLEEEAKLLEPFRQAAAAGQIVEVSEIKAAYEAAIGRSVDSSHGHIYRVLERHSWRKVMPRSQHPNKASDEEIAASKKLT